MCIGSIHRVNQILIHWRSCVVGFCRWHLFLVFTECLALTSLGPLCTGYLQSTKIIEHTVRFIHTQLLSEQATDHKHIVNDARQTWACFHAFQHLLLFARLLFQQWLQLAATHTQQHNFRTQYRFLKPARPDCGCCAGASASPAAAPQMTPHHTHSLPLTFMSSLQ